MNLVEQFSIVNTTSKKNREIKYIVIHYTAGVTSTKNAALNTASWFSNTSAKASADFIVDDNNVVQFNPDINNRYTWHCGGSKCSTKGGSFYKKCTNTNSIGIEICSNNSKKKVTTANDKYWSYTTESLANATKLVKQLMKEYDIPFENVIRHYDVTGKLCPGIIGWNIDSGDESAWNAFKAGLIDDDKKISDLEKEIEYWKNRYIILQNKLKELIEE